MSEYKTKLVVVLESDMNPNLSELDKKRLSDFVKATLEGMDKSNDPEKRAWAAVAFKSRQELLNNKVGGVSRGGVGFESEPE